MPKRVEAFFDTPASPLDEKEVKALTLWTRGKSVVEICDELDLPNQKVTNWATRWPSRRQLHMLAVNEVMAKAREIRDQNLVPALEAEIKALQEDHELVTRMREDLRHDSEATPKELKELLTAAESLTRRSNSIFDFNGSIADAKPSSPLVNINLLTQPAP